MPFIRNISTNQQPVSLFNNEVSLEFRETTRVSASRFASSEVQDEITLGNLQEVPSLNFIEGFIKGQWDMGASTALPAGTQPGDVYEILSGAIHPTSGDSFGPGDLASIGTDGILVRNLTATLAPAGAGGVGQYEWISVNSNHNAAQNQYILADSTGGSFVIVLPPVPELGDTIGIYPNQASFTVNPVTVLRGTNNIQGISDDLLLNENVGITMVFVGGSIGWLVLPLDDTVVFVQDLQADSYYTVVDVPGTAYTLLPQDSGKVLRFDDPGAITLTLPEFITQVLPRGFYVSFRNKQGGVITLTLEGTDVLSGPGPTTNDSTKLNSVYLEESAAPNLWVSVGDLS